MRQDALYKLYGKRLVEPVYEGAVITGWRLSEIGHVRAGRAVITTLGPHDRTGLVEAERAARRELWARHHRKEETTNG